jgi:hypothetical protein
MRLLVEELNPATGETSLLTPAVPGGEEADLAWTPDGTLLMVVTMSCMRGGLATRHSNRWRPSIDWASRACPGSP